MPRKEEAFRVKANEYLKYLENRGLTKEYITRSRNALIFCSRTLLDAGYPNHPKEITQEHMMYIRDNMDTGISRKKYVLTILGAYLKFCEVYHKGFTWPKVTPKRPRVTRRQFNEALEACYKARDFQGATILLLASLSCRTIGIWRMLPGYIQSDHIHVIGKGPSGGKPRDIPITSEIYDQLMEYKGWREKEIKRILQNNPNAEIPEKLIICPKKNIVTSACRSTIANITLRAGKRIGIHLTTHMIRRMICRELYEEAKKSQDLETSLQAAIKITGHEDIRTFMEYVGTIEEDSRNLMEQVFKNRKKGERQNASPGVAET